MANPDLYSHETEEALIGAILINPGIFQEIDLRAEHFHIHKMQFIWRAINALYQRGDQVDFVTIVDELDRAGKLKEIGGAAYLTSLINVTPSSLHAHDYAEIVKDYYRRRIWKQLASEIAKVAFDLDESIEEKSATIVNSLIESIEPSGAAVHASQYYKRVFDEICERRANPKDIWGIPTGFADFDKITGGLQVSEILYISGEPGMGKSIMAAQMGYQMAEAGHPGAIYSLEMPATQLIRRWLSAISKVTTREMKSGHMDDERFAAVIEKMQYMENLPVYLSDSVQWNTISLRADLARLKIQHKIEWFVLDYAYLLSDGAGLSENDRTGYISKQLKSICRALNLAGIVIHSLNKSGMGNSVPTGEHLRGSGQQFYDTDLLLFLIKSDIPNEIICKFGKGRELENPKQGFVLHKIPGLPALVNAATEPVFSGNARPRL